MKNLLIFICLLNTLPSSSSQYSATNNELFEHKNIVIFGGTGYLGRAITTEVLKYNPAKIIVYSRDEVKHFHCSTHFKSNKIHYVIGDIRDEKHVSRITKNADVVFHVAALKRMDALETNVEEAIKTDIIGSLNVFHACVKNNVPKVLFISTDKACLPINTYGACKFVSEKIFTNYDQSKIKTKFMVTRFGNILESTGSVIPIFDKKIQNGEEITLTDEKMTRFIIAGKDAAELIFDALRYGVGGEIFTKELPALKVTDLIEILKEKHQADNPIKIIGLRPGEKMHEVLVNESEMDRAYRYKELYIVRPSIDQLSIQMEELPEYMTRGKKIAVEDKMEYSSDKAVVTRDALKDLFRALSLL